MKRLSVFKYSYTIFSTNYFQPWTSDAAARQAIVETREKRQKRFEEARNRVENQDPTLREAILSLSLVELRGYFLSLLFLNNYVI